MYVYVYNEGKKIILFNLYYIMYMNLNWHMHE